MGRLLGRDLCTGGTVLSGLFREFVDSNCTVNCAGSGQLIRRTDVSVLLSRVDAVVAFLTSASASTPLTNRIAI